MNYTEFLEYAIAFGLYPAGGGGSGVTPVQVQQSVFNASPATGVNDAFQVVLDPPVTTLTDGLLIIMSSGMLQNVTTSPTLQVNALAPIDIVIFNGSIAPGDIIPNREYIFVYNGPSNVAQLINPSISVPDTFSVQQNSYNVGFDLGSANQYSVTLYPTPEDVRAEAFPLYMLVGAGNSNLPGGSTVSVNGTVVDIFLNDGSNPPGNSIVGDRT